MKINMKTTNQIGRHVLLWSCMAIIVVLMSLTASAQTLVHEYNFTDDGTGTNVVDLVGGTAWYGTLPNGGDFASIPNQLVLSASSAQYAQLPVGILSDYSAVTIDVWAQFGTLPGACFLYGFGDTDTNVLSGGQPSGYNYIMCHPQNGRIAISAADPGWQGEQGTGGAGDLSSRYVHVTSVYNPVAGYVALYTNGVMVSQNDAVTVQMSSVTNQLNYIARSLYNADSYMDVALDEFRIFNGALSPLRVAACDLSGPDTYPEASYGTVTNMQLSLTSSLLAIGAATGPATVVGSASGLPKPIVISVPDLGITYSSANTAIARVNSTNGVVTGVASGTVNIIASYAGVFATQAVQVISLPTTMIHRYSFNETTSTDGATVNDSVGTNNGVFYNASGLSSIGSGQLNLVATNKGDYVDLGSYLISSTNIANNAVTFEIWATASTGQGNWTRFWEFGEFQPGGVIGSSSGQNYWSLMPNIDNQTTARMEITNPNTDINVPSFLGRTNIHYVGVFNPNPSRLFFGLYTNGVLVGSASTGSHTLAGIHDVFSWLGRSLWSGDAALTGSINEFRIYDGELDKFQIAASDQAGPDATSFNVGTFSSFVLSTASLSKVVGSQGQINALVNFSLVTNVVVNGDAMLTFTSSNPDVVSINNAGLFSTLKVGSATITAVYGYVSGITTNYYTNTIVASVSGDSNPATLVHRYQFNDANGGTVVADSVGGSAWNGTVMEGNTNTAVPYPGAFTNGVLYLTAVNTNFVQLPSGILSNYTAVSIEIWVTFPGTLPGNCAIFNFGNTETNGGGYNYLFCQPQAGRFCISTNDLGFQGTGEQNAFSGTSWANRANFHVTAIVDPPQGYISLYTNGVLAGINIAETMPMSGVSSVLNYIGRSLYNADSYINANVDEFRIYNGVLSPDEIKATQAMGSSQVLTTNATINAVMVGGNLTLSWPVSAAGFVLQSRTNLVSGSWQMVPSPAAQIVGSQWQITVPNSGGNMFYRLVR
jgi:uncharacterized protein YjdB